MLSIGQRIVHAVDGAVGIANIRTGLSGGNPPIQPILPLPRQSRVTVMRPAPVSHLGVIQGVLWQ